MTPREGSRAEQESASERRPRARGRRSCNSCGTETMASSEMLTMVGKRHDREQDGSVQSVQAVRYAEEPGDPRPDDHDPQKPQSHGRNPGKDFDDRLRISRTQFGATSER